MGLWNRIKTQMRWKMEGVEAKHSRFLYFESVSGGRAVYNEKHKDRRPGLGFEFQSCLLLPVELHGVV